MRQACFLVLFLSFISVTFADENVNLEQAAKDLSSENYEVRLKAKEIIEKAGISGVLAVRKFNKSGDLEIKEFLEKKLNETVVYRHSEYKVEKIIGSGGKTFSFQKVINEFYENLKTHYLNSFEKNSDKSQQWHESLKKFISLTIDYFKNVELEREFSDVYTIGSSHRKNEMELRIFINKFKSQGCEDPVFLHLKQSLYGIWYDRRAKSEVLTKATEDFVKSNYSLYLEYFVLLNSRKLIQRSIYRISHFHKYQDDPSVVTKIFNVYVEMSKESFFVNKINQRMLVKWRDEFLYDIPKDLLESKIEEVCQNVGKETWLGQTIKAYYYFGNVVRLKKGFTKNNDIKQVEAILDECEKHFLAAIKLIPENPEPYNLMILKRGINLEKFSNIYEPITLGGDRIRLWFEKGVQFEIDNCLLFSSYLWAMGRNASLKDIISFGREYLFLPDATINTGQFYMKSLRRAFFDKYSLSNKFGYRKLFSDNNVFFDVNWAVEQQLALKPVNAILNNNDIVLIAYTTCRYKEAIQALHSTQGVFSVGWNVYNVGSSVIERNLKLIEKYNNTPIGNAIKSLDSETENNLPENLKYVIENVEKIIEPIDKPKVANFLATCKFLKVHDKFEELINFQKSFGYQESILVSYSKMQPDTVSEELKAKLVEHFGAKTMEALDEAINWSIKNKADRNSGKKPVTDFESLARIIKVIFMKDNQNEAELINQEEYNKAQLRGCIVLASNIYIPKNKSFELVLSYAKNLKNIGDASEFYFSHIFSINHSGLQSGLANAFEINVLKPMEQNLPAIDAEIKRLSAIKDNKELMVEVRKTWYAKGNPMMLLEMELLLQERNLLVEAEMLKNWTFFCLEGFTLGNTFESNVSESVFKILSNFKNYHKEAYQYGVRKVRDEEANVYHYMMAFHVFKLGHYHMAYEYLCKGQILKDLQSEIVLNKINFKKPNDILMYVVSEMLASKDLPEYIRFNLNDQFGGEVKSNR